MAFWGTRDFRGPILILLNHQSFFEQNSSIWHIVRRLLFCPHTTYTPVDVCTWNIMKSYWFDLMISAAPIILSFLCSQLSHLKIDFDLDLEKRLKSLWIPHIFIEMTFKTRWLKRCRYLIKKVYIFMNKFYLSQKNKDIQNQKETTVVILSL